MNSPKVLICDIETLPIEAYTWGLFDQNVSLSQIKTDWSVLSWSAKWLGDKKVMYQDVRDQKDIRDDRRILQGIWDLLNEADIVVWHYGSAFDHKKLNARFAINGFSRPSPYKQIDTKKLASKTFGFTSNKLEYLTEKLNTKYKKSKHKKFEGFAMWSECMKGNKAAFREMEAYNRMDVLSLEELYNTLITWYNPHDFRVYTKHEGVSCPTCSSIKIQKRGYDYTQTGKFARFQCQSCATWFSERGGKNNLLSKEKRQSLKGRAR